MMRYIAVFVLLAMASVPPFFLAAVIVADRLKINVPGDILVFCAAGWMAIFGLPLSLILVVCAAVSAVVIYILGRIEARQAKSSNSPPQRSNTFAP